MNGEQTMEDKIEYKSKTGHFWIGLRNGRDFPLNRNVYAMARSQEYRPGLRNGSIFTELTRQNRTSNPQKVTRAEWKRNGYGGLHVYGNRPIGHFPLVSQ